MDDDTRAFMRAFTEVSREAMARKKARRRRKVKDGFFASLGILGVLLFLSLSGLIGAICWPYALNEWLVFLGKDPKVLWWHGFLMGYIPGLGQASIPVAVITWILMLFLV